MLNPGVAWSHDCPQLMASATLQAEKLQGTEGKGKRYYIDVFQNEGLKNLLVLAMHQNHFQQLLVLPSFWVYRCVYSTFTGQHLMTSLYFHDQRLIAPHWIFSSTWSCCARKSSFGDPLPCSLATKGALWRVEIPSYLAPHQLCLGLQGWELISNSANQNCVAEFEVWATPVAEVAMEYVTIT